MARCRGLAAEPAPSEGAGARLRHPAAARFAAAVASGLPWGEDEEIERLREAGYADEVIAAIAWELSLHILVACMRSAGRNGVLRAC